MIAVCGALRRRRLPRGRSAASIDCEKNLGHFAATEIDGSHAIREISARCPRRILGGFVEIFFYGSNHLEVLPGYY